MKLKNRHAIITGASRGLGKCIAKHFVMQGASVALCARNASDLEKTRNELSSLATDNQQVIASTVDISSLSEVDDFITHVHATFKNIDILVNNAGIYGPFGSLDEINWSDWLEAININLLGTAYITKKLIPLFKSQNHGKIITLSGGGATKPLPSISAYAASKAAIVRLMETLAMELKSHNIDVNTIAPGTLATNMMDHLIANAKGKLDDVFYNKMLKIKNSGGTPLEYGAKLAVYLASEESNGITGKLISAVWDPWETLHTYNTYLKNSDIYTLRRITPEDRQMNWDTN